WWCSRTIAARSCCGPWRASRRCRRHHPSSWSTTGRPTAVRPTWRALIPESRCWHWPATRAPQPAPSASARRAPTTSPSATTTRGGSRERCAARWRCSTPTRRSRCSPPRSSSDRRGGWSPPAWRWREVRCRHGRRCRDRGCSASSPAGRWSGATHTWPPAGSMLATGSEARRRCWLPTWRRRAGTSSTPTSCAPITIPRPSATVPLGAPEPSATTCGRPGSAGPARRRCVAPENCSWPRLAIVLHCGARSPPREGFRGSSATGGWYRPRSSATCAGSRPRPR
ncbi:MAG: Putative transferase, partial [uncultured Solirubrobacteraceae bacterium]